MPTTPKLKPCPWCGFSQCDVGRVTRSNSYNRMIRITRMVFCVICGAQGPERKTVSAAIKAWNTRRKPRKAKR